MLGKRKEKNMATRKKTKGTRIISMLLALVMVVGLATALIPEQELLAANKTTNLDGFSAVMTADPHTSEADNIFNGTPAEDGKIWTDKSVTTGAMYGVTAGEQNFTVALSSIAQTYNTVTTGLTTEQKNVAYDVVFVLDFSGSMNDRIGNNSTPYKAQAMVDALNPSIATLMENEQNRIAVVGYSGTNVSSSSSTLLLDLDHYSTTTQSNGENVYFQYNSSNDRISTANGVLENAVSKDVNGGTPTQRGVYHAMQILNGHEKPNDGYIRIPIIVLLTDGAAGSARSNYRTLDGGTLYQGDANGSSGSSNSNDEVGAYTALTANYVKDTVDALYKDRYDYSSIFNESTTSAAKFYTIGLGITEDSWTHAMLDPGIFATLDANGTTANLKNYLESDATYGLDYDYADNYYGGEMTSEELSTAFGEILSEMVVESKTSSKVNDPVTTETTSVTGEDVVFTDYLGYKMELKGDSQYLRYGGKNYRFDKVEDTDVFQKYVFNGYDQDENTATGPVVTKNNKTYTLADVEFQAEYVANETYNGQTGYWKVTWSFPGAILPTYSRLTDYDNTDLDPIRMLYQVGLAEDTDLHKDSLKIDANGDLASISGQPVAQYVFHTNLYKYAAPGATPEAMTWSEYTPAKDNPYYYETGYVTNKKAAGYTSNENAKQYVRLDMNALATATVQLSATKNIVVTNISTNLNNSRAQFTYGGQTYTIALTGDRTDNAIWSGDVSIPVTATAEGGQQLSTHVSVRVEASFNDGTWRDSLELSRVVIDGKQATISGTSATLNGLTITGLGEATVETEEIISVYMEMKQDGSAYYVEDVKGNKIDVSKMPEQENLYSVTLGEKTYTSHIYYPYKQGTESYVDKQLAKGAIARSLVGQFKIKQPQTVGFDISTADFNVLKEMFQYYPSNYDPAENNVFNATKIRLADGTMKPAGATQPSQPVEGTINVCIDGILNGQTDINGNPMKVHFDFVMEEQTLVNGQKRYVLLDCNYYDAAQTYSVDVMPSDTPVIDNATDTYSYDISYTIESRNPATSGTNGNVTQTDPHFFHSHLESNGQMIGHLGNNGRLAVDISEAYAKDVTIKKEWYDRLGNKLDNNIDLLKHINITAGIYQVYSYEDSEGKILSNDGTKGIPFVTVELNQANNFQYTWDTPKLPAYLVDDGGDYVLDKNGAKVPVSYVAGEEVGAVGWTLSEVYNASEADEDVYILQNVPLAEFSPSIQKVWPDGAPDGYKVKIELLANGEPVTIANKIDTEHIVTAIIEQEDAEEDATLTANFGDVSLGSEVIHIEDFAQDNTVKAYKFEYSGEGGNGVGGEAGSGSHADKVTVQIMVSNTSGEKLSITNAFMTYHYTIKIDGVDTQQEVKMETFRSQYVEEDATKTATFVMLYQTNVSAEGILDGIVDSYETKAWYASLDKWNLPMLDKDENGNYTAITYSVRETVYVPDANGDIELEGVRYTAYAPDENGFITIPQGNNSYRVFASNITTTEDYHFTVTNDEELTSVTVSKEWIDNGNEYGSRPEKITFQLKADDVVIDSKEVTPSADAVGTATATWENLPVYKVTTDAGKNVLTEINYTVDEVVGTLPTSHQYEKTVTEDSENQNKFVVTNRLTGDPVSVGIVKNWIDNNNEYKTRPENLYMVLYRTIAGAELSTAEIVPGAMIITLNKGNNWQDTTGWTGLPKYSDAGEEYVYLVKEYEGLARATAGDVTGYDVTAQSNALSASGIYEITNKLEDGSISKTVTKVWKDEALANERPTTVVVELSAKVGDEDVAITNAVQELSAHTSWTHTWDNLPMYKDGVAIDYTIKETTVGGVAVTADTSGATSVENATVDGKTYIATIQDDGAGNEFIVTNTLTGTTSVSVEKVWKDTPVGFTAPEVTFDIYSSMYGRVPEKSLTVNDANGWTDTVSGLEKYDINGVLISYTLDEKPVTGNGIGSIYLLKHEIGTNVATDGTYKYTATNTYVPLLQDISGTKTWVGVTGDNIPDGITLELSRKVEGGTAEVIKDSDDKALQPQWTKSNDKIVWTYTYEDLPIYQDNDTSKPYVYSVKETKIGDKAVENMDFDVVVEGFDITNKLVGTVTGLSGTKTWEGVTGDNIPDSIKVQLMRKISGGNWKEAVDTTGNKVEIEVTGTGNEWNFDFAGKTLPKYDENGNAYIYLAKEISVTSNGTTLDVAYADAITTEGTVGDYAVKNEGLAITNTLGDEKVSFSMIKEWVKEESQALPSDITVKVLGEVGSYKYEETKKLALTASSGAEAVTSTGNKWKYTFENLPRYAEDGISEFAYSVRETHVGSEAVVLVDGKNQAGEWVVTTPDNDLIINSHNIKLIDLQVEKEWMENEGKKLNDLPDSIVVQLYQELAQDAVPFGVPTTIVPDENGNWSYTFKGLPRTADGTNNTIYKYFVKEVSVTADGVTEVVKEDTVSRKLVVGDYVVTEPTAITLTESDENKLTITNTLNTGDSKVKTTYPVTKNWVDVEASNIPNDITIQLMQNGTDMSGTTYQLKLDKTNAGTSNANQWKYTFDNLDKYTANGITQNVYTAKETAIESTAVNADNKAGDFFVTYAKQDKDGTVINNRLAGTDKELISYPVEKAWVNADMNNLPTSITVKLMQGVNEVSTTEITAESDWKHTFTGIRKYADDGLTPYQYSAAETKIGTVDVVGDKAGAYDVSVEVKADNAGTKITNTINNDRMKKVINVTKTWEGVSGDNIPDSILVQLHGGKDVIREGLEKTSYAQGATTWTHTFTEVPVYRADGVTKYEYTIKESTVTADNTTLVVVYTDAVNGTVGDYNVVLGGDAEHGFTITNTLKDSDHKDYSTSFPVEKKWDIPAGISLPESVTVELHSAVSVSSEATKLEEKVLTAADHWTHTFTGLRKYTDNGITECVYSVKETKVGDTAVSATNTAGAYSVSVDGNVITNKIDAIAMKDITVTKTWVGVAGDNIPNIEVVLLQNGRVFRDAVLSKDTQTAGAIRWTYEFTNVPVYLDGVIEYEYTVQEQSVNGIAVETVGGVQKAGDYEVTVDQNNFAITNTLTGTIDSLQVEKIWKDKATETERPRSIEVEVVRKIATDTTYTKAGANARHTLTAANGWKTTITEQYPKYDPNGNLYTYKVVEVDSSGDWVLTGDTIKYGSYDYQVTNSINSEGKFVITNTLTGNYNNVEVTKVWLDDNNSQNVRPEQVTVKLYQEGAVQALEEVTVKAEHVVSGDANRWSTKFSGTYPKYDAEGNLLTYYVSENPVDNYRLKEVTGNITNGFTVTNVYAPGQKTLTINKVWVDDNNKLGLRPTDELVLNILQNGAFYEHAILNVSTASMWTVMYNVPIADANGKLYVYSVEEPQGSVNAEYAEPVYSAGGLTVTNKLEGTVNIAGTKKWNKIDEAYRPESVTVGLWRKTNNSVEEQVMNAADNNNPFRITTTDAKDWKYDFGALDKYDETGALYTYIVKEVLVGGTPYADSDYVVSAGTGYDLVNAIKESTKTEVVVNGIKTWSDNDNKYGMRPEMITVHLLRDGQRIDSAEVKADASGNWSYEFKDLPKYDMETGKLYVYSIEEASVKDYFVTVNGNDLYNVLDMSKIPIPIVKLEKTQALGDGTSTSESIKTIAGDVITYTIKASNTGVTEATNVNIVDKIPAGLVFVKDSAKGGDAVSVGEDGTITWTISELLPGKSAEVSFKVTVPKVVKDTTWVNVATVVFGSIPGGPEGSANSNKVEIFSGVPDLEIKKAQQVNGTTVSTDSQVVNKGDKVTYTITVKNYGTGTAADLVITDKVPGGLVLVKDSITDGGQYADGVITWKVDYLKENESMTVSFDVMLPTIEKATIWINTAEVTCDNNPKGSDVIEKSNEVELVGKVTSPATNDNAAVSQWTMAMTVSLMICAAYVVERKRKTN